jgi:hypothetical protein
VARDIAGTYNMGVSRLSADLVEAVARGECAVFCGAGLSIPAGLPSGAQLAEHLADRLDSFDGNRRDLTEVASVYEAERGRHALISFFIDRIESLSSGPSAVHEALCRLPVTAFITTNWDDLLERTLLLQKRDHAVLVTDREVPFLRGGALPVIKLHGTLNRPDTIVVTDRDYHELFLTQPAVLSLLDSLFSTKTIIFIGYALGDSDFKRLYYSCTMRFGRLSRRAYAVQRNPRDSIVNMWRSQQIEVIDENAADFVAELASAVPAKP